MPDIRIVTDTTASLPPGFAAAHGDENDSIQKHRLAEHIAHLGPVVFRVV
jgi:hypothetical protein